MLQAGFMGIEEAIANVLKIHDVVHSDQMSEGAMKALEPVAVAARDLAPYLSGDLRDSIVVSKSLPDGSDAEFNGRAVFVGPLTGDIFYAGFLELGTVKMRAYPFLAPAVDANEVLVFEILGQETGRMMLEAF